MPINGANWYSRCRAGLLGAALLLALCPGRSAHSAEPYPADAVKAVFLYRFAGYVQWPPESLAARQFTIAVLGADEVAAQLERLLPNHPILGVTAQAKRITGPQQLDDAQILYVGADYGGSLRAVIAALGARPVLVVSDAHGGLEAGSSVNFVLRDQHVRFEISTAAAKRAGLKISSELLAVATHIKADNRPSAGCGAAAFARGRDGRCVALVGRR